MANDDYDDDGDVLELESASIPREKGPAPVTLEIAGKEYEARWTKDHYWMQYFASFNSDEGHALFRASMELLRMSVGPSNWAILDARLRNMNDDIDTPDLMAATWKLTAEYAEYAESRMSQLGVEIPEKFNKNTNRAERRAAVKPKKARIVKAPSAKRK